MRFTSVLFITLVFSLPVFADSKPFQHELSLSLLGAGSYRALSSSKFNTRNNILLLPDRLGTFEARPQAKMYWNEFTLQLRPRWINTYSTAHNDFENNKTEHSSKVQWSEADLTWNFTPSFFMVYGLQNFQWGPAESTSPSNRIFHETISSKDVLYETKGHHLLRFNLTPSQTFSEVIMAELSDNGDPEFEAEQGFARKALSKSEWNWNGGTDYAGGVVGWRDRSGFWVGEYANIDAIEGLSVFADISHQQGSLSWHPTQTDGTSPIVLMQSARDKKRLYTFAVTGIKYAFENGTDLRAEWIYQEAGYSQTELNSLWSALTSPSIPQRLVLAKNATRLEKVGLDFLGQQYFFISARFSDFLKVKNWLFYVRELVSAQDGSSTFYVSSENSVGDSGTAFFGVALTSGKEETDLGGFTSLSATGGYKHSW